MTLTHAVLKLYFVVVVSVGYLVACAGACAFALAVRCFNDSDVRLCCAVKVLERLCCTYPLFCAALRCAALFCA